MGHNLLQDTTGTCTFNATGDKTGVDPLLGPLADNGGSLETRALASGSPAVDAGDPGTPGSAFPACAATDERGVTRPQFAACDMGAFEFQGTLPTPTPTPTPTPVPSFNLKKAIKHCKKKFPKGPKRKRCIKRAKRKAGA
jgi:hypothetical protein